MSRNNNRGRAYICLQYLLLIGQGYVVKGYYIFHPNIAFINSADKK